MLFAAAICSAMRAVDHHVDHGLPGHLLTLRQGRGHAGDGLVQLALGDLGVTDVRHHAGLGAARTPRGQHDAARASRAPPSAVRDATSSTVPICDLSAVPGRHPPAILRHPATQPVRGSKMSLITRLHQSSSARSLTGGPPIVALSGRGTRMCAGRRP